MKIINLKAQNIQKIKAVDVTPKKNAILVGGYNEQGKTSLLNSILMALGGKSGKFDMPIREGTTEGNIEIDLGDYIVSKKYTAKGEYLTIKSKDGATYPSPQAMLDKIYGSLTFDPLEFSRMKSKDQMNTLKTLVGLDFTEADTERKKLFDERTIINRDVKSLESQVNPIPLNVDCPEEEVSVSELMAQLKNRREANQKRTDSLTVLSTLKNTLVNIETQIKELEDSLVKAREFKNEQLDLISVQEELMEHFPAYDTEDLESQIQNSQSVNAKVRENKKKKDLENSLSQKQAKADELSNKIGDIDAYKEKTLKETKFPIQGLSFDENGVYYNAIPLSQCSSAETLKISIAMGIEMNTKLRVMLVRDGSLMDDNSLNIVKDMAEAYDFQIWIERVGENENCEIIIEDGMVKDMERE